MSENVHIHFIADYGKNDLAFSEVIVQINKLIPESQVYPLSVPPFSTLNAGFSLAQLALVENLKNTYFYVNVAPRLGSKKDNQNASGQGLAYVKLQNGNEIIAVNSGYTLSFLKGEIAEFREINVQIDGSQFRSRDYFPLGIKDVHEGSYKLLGADISTESIPDVPEQRVAHIDGYGNIKTTIRLSELQKLGEDKVFLEINGITAQAVIAGTTPETEVGHITLGKGSSGFDDPFIEVWVKMSSAWEFFGKPKVGSDIVIAKSGEDIHYY